MPEDTEIYTVSQLCRECRLLLENHFFQVMVEGELSNLTRPASGHLYFTLKDNQAQVQCALFRPKMRGLLFRPENGQQVSLRARVSLYEARGNFQLIVEHMEEAGDGALRRAFEQLKQKLAGEGLFDLARKQALPAIPKQIGVITSPSGAAIRDILTVLKRRFPTIPVLIYPVSVQGESARHEIVRALERAESRAECDVLILARGGGSLEDLWAFNEESVARAMAACSIPIVSGVGHEVDVNIADFVADQRAATPSAAAELISPDRIDLIRRVAALQNALVRHMQSTLTQRQQALDWTGRHLQKLHPGQRLQRWRQTLQGFERTLIRSIRQDLARRQNSLQAMHNRLLRCNPGLQLRSRRETIANINKRLRHAVQTMLENKQGSLHQFGQNLHLVSPLATLQRGYSITEQADTHRILYRSQDIRPGERITTRLAQGQLVSCVETVDHDA